MLDIIGMKEVMRDYKLGRKKATDYFNRKGCPLLPRVKNGPYQVVREEFEEWLRTRRR